MIEGTQFFTTNYCHAMNDPYLRNLYRLRLSAIRNRVSEISEAREEGIEEGIKEGIELAKKKGMAIGEVKTKYAIVRSMILDGVPLELIYRCVPATPAEIDEMIIRLKAEA